ncbi:MAG: TetR/AcrR family transcriptional regulator [Maribacter sp.]
MTDKKEQILLTALKLFANKGYKAVATSKIAKQAGVSEGLIFRHYKSKQGLLEAILHESFERINALIIPIMQEENPQDVIKKYILLPFEIQLSEYQYWKLLFKLKWEIEYSSVEKLRPLIQKLTWSFEKLKYSEPQKEAEVLIHIIESVSGGILKDGLESHLVLKDFLLNKYKS